MSTATSFETTVLSLDIDSDPVHVTPPIARKTALSLKGPLVVTGLMAYRLTNLRF